MFWLRLLADIAVPLLIATLSLTAVVAIAAYAPRGAAVVTGVLAARMADSFRRRAHR